MHCPMRSGTKTSVDILRERDVLEARVRELEAVIAATRIEIRGAIAMEEPKLHRETLRRVAALVQRT